MNNKTSTERKHLKSLEKPSARIESLVKKITKDYKYTNKLYKGSINKFYCYVKKILKPYKINLTCKSLNNIG